MRRTGVLGVHSLDHFCISVPDLSEAKAFYTEFGLDARPDGNGTLMVRAVGSDHCWIRIVEGERKRLEYISFAAFSEDMPRFRENLVDLGVAPVEGPLGADDASIWLRDPAGILVQIKVAERSAPTEKSSFDGGGGGFGQRNAASRSTAPKVHPRRLAHIAIFTAGVLDAIEFYTKTLGLRLSDQSADAVAFLHGAHGSEHHMLALLGSAGGGLHHSSWDVGSVDEVGLGAMHMADKGFDRGWGMGRHVLGSNYFHYVRDPWGSYAEYTADMDYIPVDLEWPAANHAPEDSMYLWGPSVPEDFVTNFELG
tara:strand:- start:3506 stop:4435 length:930 start_codon:yes stop_codon:yes gene_type:complete